MADIESRMPVDDGGPAFPGSMVTTWPSGMETTDSFPGMSLRDHFAGLAFGAMMSGARGLGEAPEEERADLFLKVSRVVYEAADAMLAARKEGRR